MALALGGAVWTLRLWRADLHVPFSYENDGQFYAVLVKQVIHGWYLTNSQLGAPFGSQLFDFPQGGDQLSFLIIKALGIGSSDWALVMNVFHLLTFPLIALSGYAVMRRLGASPPAGAVCSTLYSLLPYHFWHGEFHLFLSAYYAVPLACYLVIAIYRGDSLLARSASGRRGFVAWASRRSLATLALCCVIGSADLYYAAFTIVLLTFATAVVVVRRRSLGPLVSGLIPAAAILVMVVINLSPTVVYNVSQGRDSQALIRTPAQSKRGSLDPLDLVLPLSHHRIAALGRLRQSYSGRLRRPEVARSEGESATLGLLATAGLIWLILTLLATLLRRGRRWDPAGVFRPIAAAGVSSLLFATVGGIAIAYLVTPDIREWMRLSIFIGFCALLAVSLLLDRMRAHVRRWRTGVAGSTALLLAVGLVAFLDQTSSQFIPPYRSLAAEYQNDAAFVRANEQRLPPGAAVFQLPYMPWPEPGFVERMRSFDPVRGYLHSRMLRWSYGAMRGRPADWQAQLAGYPAALQATAAVAAGFRGIYIDQLGYTASVAQRVGTTLTRLLGARPMVRRGGRLWFFDARPYAKRLLSSIGAARTRALRRATLYPVWLDAGAGTGSESPGDFPVSGVGIHGPVRIRGHGEIEARDPPGDQRAAVFNAQLSIAGPATATAIQFPGGPTVRLTVGSHPTVVCQLLRIRQGAAIRFTVAGAGALRIDRARLTDVAFEPFLGRERCGA